MPNLIGSQPHQLPANGFLGSAAFCGAEDFERALRGGEFDLGNSGAASTITWAQRTAQKLTLTGNCTLSMVWSGAPYGRYWLRLVQDATGGRTITWSTGAPGASNWIGSAAAPALNAAANGQTLVSVLYLASGVVIGAAGRVGAL